MKKIQAELMAAGFNLCVREGQLSRNEKSPCLVFSVLFIVGYEASHKGACV